MKPLIALTLALLLAGCGAESNWAKPGASEEQARADWDQCRNAMPPARGTASSGFGTTRGQDAQGRNNGVVAQTDQLQAARSCMRERGWQPRT